MRLAGPTVDNHQTWRQLLQMTLTKCSILQRLKIGTSLIRDLYQINADGTIRKTKDCLITHTHTDLMYHYPFTFLDKKRNISKMRSKWFHKFWHKNLFEWLGKRKLHGEDIRIIQNVDLAQSVCILTENKLGSYINKKKGNKARMLRLAGLILYLQRGDLERTWTKFGGRNPQNIRYKV